MAGRGAGTAPHCDTYGQDALDGASAKTSSQFVEEVENWVSLPHSTVAPLMFRGVLGVCSPAVHCNPPIQRHITVTAPHSSSLTVWVSRVKRRGAQHTSLGGPCVQTDGAYCKLTLHVKCASSLPFIVPMPDAPRNGRMSLQAIDAAVLSRRLNFGKCILS